MAPRYTPVWGCTRRPAAASAGTDAESGGQEESLRRSLRALAVMRDRGLITEAEYEEHRAAAEARER